MIDPKLPELADALRDALGIETRAAVVESFTRFARDTVVYVFADGTAVEVTFHMLRDALPPPEHPLAEAIRIIADAEHAARKAAQRRQP